MVVDYHAHSTYSDGSFLWAMLRAADEAGLEGIGIADHCNVSTRERPQRFKKAMGFNLDRTYERRRDAIASLGDRFDLQVYDGVEIDYDPRDEAEIHTFLEEAKFAYAIGSIHTLDGTNVHYRPHFAEKDDDDRADLVGTYYDRLVQLIESELFEIAAHVDVVERNPALRGYGTEDQYRRVATAFTDSRTIPELNAGRVLSEYGQFHPAPPFVETLREHGIDIVIGSDAHEPDEIEPRHTALADHLATTGIEPVQLDC